jgi:hypothetical protein
VGRRGDGVGGGSRVGGVGGGIRDLGGSHGGGGWGSGGGRQRDKTRRDLVLRVDLVRGGNLVGFTGTSNSAIQKVDFVSLHARKIRNRIILESNCLIVS